MEDDTTYTEQMDIADLNNTQVFKVTDHNIEADDEEIGDKWAVSFDREMPEPGNIGKK